MKKIIFFSLFLSFIMGACSNIDPVKYNDSIVEYSNDADKHVETFWSQINQAAENNNISKFSEYAKVTIDSLNSEINKMNELKQPSGAEAFHKASIAYIESLIPYVQAIADEYSQITEETTDEQFDQIDNDLLKLEDDSNAKLEDMIKCQQEFAKAKKFTLSD